jgi:hypothetical protein
MQHIKPTCKTYYKMYVLISSQGYRMAFMGSKCRHGGVVVSVLASGPKVYGFETDLGDGF